MERRLRGVCWVHVGMAHEGGRGWGWYSEAWTIESGITLKKRTIWWDNSDLANNLSALAAKVFRSTFRRENGVEVDVRRRLRESASGAIDRNFRSASPHYTPSTLPKDFRIAHTKALQDTYAHNTLLVQSSKNETREHKIVSLLRKLKSTIYRGCLQYETLSRWRNTILTSQRDAARRMGTM